MPKRNKKNFRPTKSGAGMTKPVSLPIEEQIPVQN